jgi:hypothetical protein
LKQVARTGLGCALLASLSVPIPRRQAY